MEPGFSPAPSHSLNDPKYHQAEPKIDGKADIGMKRHVSGTRRQVGQEQEVSCVAAHYGNQGVDEIRHEILDTDFRPLAVQPSKNGCTKASQSSCSRVPSVGLCFSCFFLAR